MNIYPKLKFQLNIDLDNEMAYQFMDMNAGGIDFSNRIVQLYPELIKAKQASGDVRREIIADFTKKYYLENKTEIDDTLLKIKDDWKTEEDSYFDAVNNFFDSTSWSKGDYVCYLSIFDCNPRFLENKSFQVYFHHVQGTNHVIAHEMLHFIFFDYLDRNELEFKNTQDEHTIWLLSELFDDLVLDLPEFKKFANKVNTGYPEVIEFSKMFGNLDKASFNVRDFFRAVKSVYECI